MRFIKNGDRMIIGIGCDIVKLARMQSLMLKKGHLKILTDAEKKLYEEVSFPRKCEWLAGRFAAKEAVIKAMAKERALLLSQVSILYDGVVPSCHIDGYRIHVSISHEEDYAIAYVIVESEV